MNSADALEYGRIDYPNIDIIEGLKSRKLLAFKSYSMVYKCITWSMALFCLTLLSPDITQPLRFFLLSPPIATDVLRIRHKAYRRCKPWWECSLLRNFEMSIMCLGQSNLMGGTGTWIQGCETHIKRCYEDETAGETPLTPASPLTAQWLSHQYTFTPLQQSPS